MKSIKKLDDYEPTIVDVLEVVKTGFARHDDALKSLHDGQEQLIELLNERTGILDKRVSNLQNRVEDIAEMLESSTQVTNKNKVSILNHERRIVHLEKLCT